MSAAPIIPISGLGSRIKRTVKGSWREQGDALAFDAGLTGDNLSGRISARDFFTNAAARMGWGTPSVAEGGDYNLVRLSFNYWLLITLYRNHWIAQRIVDTPAKDMVRAWPKISSEMKPDDIAAIDRTVQKTQTKKHFLQALKWGRLFGGSSALIMIDGQENQLSEPLDIQSVELDSYCGLLPFDRWTGIYPAAEVSTDIRKPREFNLPEFYEISVQGGQRFTVHSSRILRFTGNAARPER